MNRNGKSSAVVLAVASMLVTGAALAADTLVVREGDAFKPGAAKSWTAAGDTVTFVLADGQDGAKVAQTLAERLATAKVSFENGQLKIAGVPVNTLLDQLTAVSLSGEADPLAALAGLGGAGAQAQSPEGGGSIRASKPTAFAVPGLSASQGGESARPRIFAEHDPSERLEAEVVEVTRGSFPAVTLRLKIKKSAKAGTLKKQLYKGKVVEAQVMLLGQNGIDLQQAGNQRNLVAYYLAAGDRVVVHALTPASPETDIQKVEVDWIERVAH